MRTRFLRKLNINQTKYPEGRAHISAASGLVMVGDRCFAIADDELHLICFKTDPTTDLHLLALRPGQLPDEPSKRKAAKPDFEALVLIEPWHFGEHEQRRALFVMGSGSVAQTRQFGALLFFNESVATSESGLDLFTQIKAIDLEPLYTPLVPLITGLNIEGAVIVGDTLKLLQRGNSVAGQSAIIEYELAQFMAWLLGETNAAPLPNQIVPLQLPSIAGVLLAPTDAAQVSENSWVISAVAEDTASSYHDGPCLGSAIVVFDTANTQLAHYFLEGSPKVEGICGYASAGELHLSMVTDADDPHIASQFLTVGLPIL